LSYPFWKRRLAGDRSIVGSTINLNHSSVTVIGVLPENIRFRRGLFAWRQSRALNRE
jgi:hypothetical protein